MPIRVTCPQGHTLLIKDECAGRFGFCPVCKGKFDIPKASGPLSEDAIMDLLGPQKVAMPQPAGGPAQAVKAKTPASVETDAVLPQQACIKCHEQFPAEASVCPYCHTFNGARMDRFRRR